MRPAVVQILTWANPGLQFNVTGTGKLFGKIFPC